ncbi:MAG: hypothetical protein PSX42_15615 [bacterium]|nr:hypothetical protein [bacterium]
MKYSVKVIFGKEQVNKFYNNDLFSKEEIQTYVKEFDFNTEAEKAAFCKGIEEAVGWMECYIDL